MSSAQPSTSTAPERRHKDEHITEDEASLYDRQIRLWGLEAQNRMRSSTVLILCLRSLAHETIKNLVLAGIGRLIVMDDGVVTEEDLGSGFLFREEDGAVGTERTSAAAPQISSLNPLVSLAAIPTLSPFIRDPQGSAAHMDEQEEMVNFLKREGVDVVVTCDLTIPEAERIDTATRAAGSMFYAAGTFGFHGYVFVDLNRSFDFVITTKDGIQKKTLSYPSLSTVLDRSNWTLGEKQRSKGASPFRDLARTSTKERNPGEVIGVLALWEFEKRHGQLPTGKPGQRDELFEIAETLRKELGINEKVLPSVDESIVDHLAEHATHSFAPTLAILGGLLAQDVLRVLSRKDAPIANLLTVGTLTGNGAVSRWAMDDARDA